jgi:heme A synthase
MTQNKPFSIFAWSLVVYNLAVILWGALVRATGSGAGCGSHWPLCNGEVIPLAPSVETRIEFTHRLMSGVDGLLVLLLVIWAWRAFGKGHPVRFGAALSLLFIISESLVGAGLVKFGWVAHNDSIERVIVMGVHLVNTFFLLAGLVLTAWWGSGGPKVRLDGQGAAFWALGLGILGVLLIGVTGAITALGDTLYPVDSLAEGIRQDFDPVSPFLVRVRVFHPIVAIGVGFYLIFVGILAALMRPEQVNKRLAIGLVVLFLVQLAAGLINLLLRAPVAMQLIHLLLADLVWINLVLLTASVLRVGAEQPAGQIALSSASNL